MYNKNMASARSLYPVFRFIVKTKEPLKLGMCNLAWGEIITIPTNSSLHVNNYKHGDNVEI
jgi:hypothetical protein